MNDEAGGELSGVPYITGKKKLKFEKSTAVRGHMFVCHVVSLIAFKILSASASDFHLKIKGSLFISLDTSVVHQNEVSHPLHLFWVIRIPLFYKHFYLVEKF